MLFIPMKWQITGSVKRLVLAKTAIQIIKDLAFQQLTMTADTMELHL